MPHGISNRWRGARRSRRSETQPVPRLQEEYFQDEGKRHHPTADDERHKDTAEEESHRQGRLGRQGPRQKQIGDLFNGRFWIFGGLRERGVLWVGTG